MLTFTQFLESAARKGQVVNTLFEEGLFKLVGVLEKIIESGLPPELAQRLRHVRETE